MAMWTVIGWFGWLKIAGRNLLEGTLIVEMYWSRLLLQNTRTPPKAWADVRATSGLSLSSELKV